VRRRGHDDLGVGHGRQMGAGFDRRRARRVHGGAGRGAARCAPGDAPRTQPGRAQRAASPRHRLRGTDGELRRHPVLVEARRLVAGAAAGGGRRLLAGDHRARCAARTHSPPPSQRTL
ncbi:MAG: hypothetical protein AVDCRST_MAG71-53, partial [uncultured Lysobacter sp.]